ncbi:MAG: 23S rRNA (uracil(1939)-C(5))-methyltransferase RlmD [Bacteroidia bacterium]|nr:23S rRNA (uracil(1939)-C(5))-methyltransferase RlmD [Bacteroidia bacterium]MCF8426762.1 23S rRNA (uracil(1939)-C(5))-methyltransferase RlmD [Bacteroidia bacterium]MCF8445554.1 23S rRNA (uracil(1939)-C(5))-methyltransferase RlmD [Bacteroidia bacterium]
MGKKKNKEPKFYQNLQIDNAGSEGKSIARLEGKVVMVEYAVPGDIVNARVIQSKRRFELATITELIQASPDRVETFCQHFGVCGGCKWQQMSYEAQLRYKQQQVLDAFERIGKFPFPPFEPILGSNRTTHYRNKVEFSSTDRKWLTNKEDIGALTKAENAGLGYHIPGRFDKVFDLFTCHLMAPLNDAIRNSIRDFCIENDYDFFNLYGQTGYLRNLTLRNNMRGEWMLIVSLGYEDKEKQDALLNHIHVSFPEITALLYVINDKRNDTIFDLDIKVFAGNDYLLEELEDFKFKIGPKSFFQTNAYQTIELYKKAREFAGLTGNELVYDLYTGVGTIALFVSKLAKKVVGIEYVEQAIEDAKKNAELNAISHTDFYAGDMKDLLTSEFIEQHGKPDVVITDPPRAGMHEDVINQLLQVRPARIVYVSCNPATQARDIALMADVYEVKKVQPVDMFPHTHHVENIALLELK